MKFNLAEKLAIVKAIDEVILVDGKVDKREIDFLAQLMDILKFDRVLIEEARKITAKECMQVLKAMPDNKKTALGVMLSEMANADGEFNEDEYRLIFNLLLEAGIDIFDCVYPTRVARNGTCFTLEGMLNLKNARFKEDKLPIDPECICPTCSRYSRGYLRHLFAAKEILGPMLVTHHNLQFLYTMMDQARNAINKGEFLSFKSSFLERFRGKV